MLEPAAPGRRPDRSKCFLSTWYLLRTLLEAADTSVDKTDRHTSPPRILSSSQRLWKEVLLIYAFLDGERKTPSDSRTGLTGLSDGGHGQAPKDQ